MKFLGSQAHISGCGTWAEGDPPQVALTPAERKQQEGDAVPGGNSRRRVQQPVQRPDERNKAHGLYR